MSTKECIDFLKVQKKESGSNEYLKIFNGKIDEIIERLQIGERFVNLLERGQKFEKMWEELKSKYGTFFRDTEERRCLGEMMSLMEHEYFPKEIRKSIEVEVLASNKEVIDELAKDIEDMGWDRKFNKGTIRVVSTRWVRS